MRRLNGLTQNRQMLEVPALYPGLEYRDDIHEYRFNGVVLPGVTTVLSVLSQYAGIPINILQEAADRGTAVHAVTELHDLGTLDYGSLSDDLVPYLMAWQQFLEDTKPELITVEKRTYHPTMKYAGTLDREMVLFGHLSVVDLKSTYKLMPSTGPQTWGYRESENAHRKNKTDHIKRRFGLQLKRDMTYELHPMKDDLNDGADFCAALRVYNWNQRSKKACQTLLSK